MCILLAFISRSGSTLLARYLDAIPTVGVTLEANLPDGIFRPELVIEHPKAIDRALDTLFDDAKFRAWSIAPEAVRARMLEHSFPLRFATLLPDILKLAFADRDVAWPVLKQENCIWRLEATRRLYPESQVVFIERDPRAIYNSQRTAIDSQTGKPMANNPFVVGLMYARAAERARCHANKPWFHRLRYEDLVANPAGTLRTLLTALGIDAPVPDSFALEPPSSDYARQIPDAQRHLHTNVAGPLRHDRVSAWRTELSPSEIDVIQWIAGRAMERSGYTPVASRLSWPARFSSRVSSLGRAVGPLTRAVTRVTRLARADRRAAA